MRIHFGSLASNNGFQIKMRLYKISLLGGAYRKKCMMWRLGGGVVMAVEKCRMWRWSWGGYGRVDRVERVNEGGVGYGRGEVCFWFFVLRLKARPRKLLLRQIADAIYDEPIRNWVRRVPRHSKQIVSSKPTAFAAATDTKRLCRHESTRKGLEGYMQISCRSRYLDSK